jgi:hypothetical protein
MRPRFVVLASLLAALAALVVPGVAGAAPRHNRGLTVNVTPDPILAGEAVLIYGQLNTPPVSDQKIVLYHHVAGSGQGYTRVSTTRTDSHGFYSFPRAEDVVMTNRSWFVREPGIHGVHSRTVYEKVAALVSIAASVTQQDTNHPVVFTGHVTPDHSGGRVALQEQVGSSDDWKTLKTGRIGPGSNYSISYRFRVPNAYDVRVLFRGDNRNAAGASDPVTVTIQQAQVPGFTISSSAPVVDEGQPVTISGVLDQPSSTTGEPNTMVTLYARPVGQSGFVPVANTTTGSDGSYSFAPQMPTGNTLYEVKATFAPSRHSAVLLEGVRDVVTMTASSTSSTVGGKVTFNGTVLPDKAGHVIYLERLGADNDWHVVEVRYVRSNSTFQFGWRFGNTGTREFRARITSDARNVGAASAPVTITVSPAPTSSLPPGS